MSTRINTVFVGTLGAVSLLLMPVSGALADWPSMNGGMMGDGNWYRHGSAWLPALAIIVLGVVLFAVLRKKN
jgi:hypothetical protein